MTTRPELTGSFGMVSSTHWLATAVGQSVLERGGNAFDAAAAAGFALQVVEPHLNGPGGEVPILLQAAGKPPVVVCGQGTAPAAATAEAFAALGLDTVPGTGLLPATVPGAFGAWALLVERWGSWGVADVLGPAIALARDGAPVLPRLSDTLARMAPHFREHWTPSAETYLVDDGTDGVPAPWSRLRLPGLAGTYERVVQESGTGPHEQQWQRARDAWYAGFVAEAVDDFFSSTRWRDTSGGDNPGLLRGSDLAAWQPTVEVPATLEHRGVQVCKTALWGQGPVMLQTLGMLDALGAGDEPLLDAHGTSDPEWLHAWAEATKLALADREAWYGDSPGADSAGADGSLLADLLDRDYLAGRAALVGSTASAELRPGSPGGRTPRLPPAVHAPEVGTGTPAPPPGAGEPTIRRDGLTRGDTVHVDVVDRWGNVVSATPSGAWLQSSPVLPALGFPLGTRGQMFWLEQGLPSSLRPGVRPRTTLSPTLALRDGKPWLALGTPGGDQQDQWSTVFLARAVSAAEHGGGVATPLQALVDAPMLHSEHMPSSFHPRTSRPNRLVAEDRFGTDVLADLRRRGHDVAAVGGWELGRLCVVGQEGGWLRAAANSRGAQGYAAGR